MILDRFPTVEQVKTRIEDISDENYRNAFKYMFLVAGRVSEVCGIYAPYGSHAYRCEIEGEEAVLFAVKTARKKKNPFRAAALPLNREPWARDVLGYFERTPDENPFIFMKKRPFNPRSNVRKFQWKAEEVFSDLEWPIPKYTVTRKKVSDNDQFGFIFELANRGQVKLDYTPPSTESDTTDEHKRNFTSMSIRYMRAFDLLLNYRFNPIELSIFGGWKTSTLSIDAPSFIQRYLDIGSRDPPHTFLEMIARMYFRQFLVISVS